ncbi:MULTISPECIES: DUF4880 domain-containing protein [Pseudomonas]|uniref:DUF4880 domain-containing protein n=1 Tax=Pseudomonas guariconensis TaxID=1288410 RepID=UPI002096C061|nr:MULTISPECIES: DUF4880 domain-containing protein [Pseudomonas]MCO7594006.1 DUF4880 domain-containing protein [Pseudomonas guariconensis]MCU7219386.1 DUF4880 domain-containing protein [Pseudomonas brassicacearum]
MSKAIEQAIEWTACLGSGEVSPREQQAFEAWLAADPAHVRAWTRVQGHLALTLTPLAEGGPALRQTLQSAPSLDRRHLLRGALAMAGLGLGSYLLGKTGLAQELAADLRSGTAERLARTLPDGSRLLLDACSAADLHFDAQAREVRLRKGKLQLQVVAGARPFTVRTPDGQVQTTDARFTVALQAQASRVWVQASSVAIRTLGGAEATLGEGHGVRFDVAGIQRLAEHRRGESSWTGGWLSVDDWSLGELVEALRPYRRGILRIAPQAADLRVSGLFPLDDSDGALRALEQTMPLRIEQTLGWWTRIELRG